MEKESGSALIITLILISVISTASFAILRLSSVETNAARNLSANTKAYYLAEGGIEEGLLRWRYNNNVTLIPDQLPSNVGSREANKIWLRREFLASGAQTVGSRIGDQVVSDVSDLNTYQALTIYNQVSSAVGNAVTRASNLRSSFNFSGFDLDNYLENRPDLLVKKDNKIIFGFGGSLIDDNQADDIDIAWRWQKLAREDEKEASLDWNQRTLAGRYGVEFRLYRKTSNGVSLLAKKIYSPPDANHKISGSTATTAQQSFAVINTKANMNSTAFGEGETYLTITPLNADIVVGAFAKKKNGQSIVEGGEIGDSISHIESIGIADGRMRGLSVKINQNSGKILGLYDYVIYEGN